MIGSIIVEANLTGNFLGVKTFEVVRSILGPQLYDQMKVSFARDDITSPGHAPQIHMRGI